MKKPWYIQLFILTILALCVTRCGTGNPGATGPQGPTGQTGAPTPTLTSIDPSVSAIAAEHPTLINPGINCTVQQVTGGNWLSSSSPGYPGSGLLTLGGSAEPYTQTIGFNQPSVDTGGNSAVGNGTLYQNDLVAWTNYKISCPGFLIVTQAGTYDFDVNSDDGSILTVSGLGASYNLNNDGNHAMTDKSTSNGSWLYPGVYNFNLQYAQSGAGYWGLIVSWYINGVESVIPAENFYH
jgi:hypothetical protein